MKKRTAQSKAQKTWRSIQQSFGRRPLTPAARRQRRRHFIKTFLVVGLLLGIIAASIFGLCVARRNYDHEAIFGPAHRVWNIAFHSDGVLTKAWFDEIYPLHPGGRMLEINVHKIKSRLEAFGQVKKVSASLQLPDRLEVVVEEREPILRARLKGYPAGKNLVLIARDGVIYRGVGYPPGMLARLPYIDGVRFIKKKMGFKPVAGMNEVGDLLMLARRMVPEIYETFEVVSCGKFKGDTGAMDALIEVRSGQLGRITFLPGDFEGQLARLAEIVQYSAARRKPGIERVDLSLGGQVVVQYSPDRKAFPWHKLVANKL